MCKSCSLPLPAGGGPVAAVQMESYQAWNEVSVSSPSLRHAFLHNTAALVWSIVGTNTEFNLAESCQLKWSIEKEELFQIALNTSGLTEDVFKHLFLFWIELKRIFYVVFLLTAHLFTNLHPDALP